MSAGRAKELGIKPLARIRGACDQRCVVLAYACLWLNTDMRGSRTCVPRGHILGRCIDVCVPAWCHCTGFADAAQTPIDFPTAPSLAVPLALKQAGVTIKDIQFSEVNEAFAAVVLANMKVTCPRRHFLLDVQGAHMCRAVRVRL